MLWLLALLAVMPVANVVAQVAKIGSTEYATLEAAFAAATDGQTVTLLADCAGNGIKAPQGKFGTNGLTVDFANHTYTVNGNLVGSTGTESQAFQLLKGNNITFKNGTITSEKAKILVQNYSNLTLKGMTLTLNNPNYASAYTLSNNNGDVVIDGTTINANPAGGFAFDVCRYASYPSVSVTVTGESEINGNVEVSASGNSASEGLNLTLTSGEINGAIVVDPSATAAMAAAPEKASITKADEFKVNVAQIGDNKYESLAEAIAAANAGNVVELLQNVDLGAGYLAIDKALTITGAYTVTSSAAQAILLTGSGDFTLDGTTVVASKGHGIQAGNDEVAYSGKLSIENSTLTVAKRGVRVYEESTGFGINVANSVIQSSVADPTTTYTTGNDAMGLSLGTSDNKGYSVTITNSEIRGFSYDINSVTSGSNLTVTMTGGKTYGRAAINVWGSNNIFTLDGVEVNGLNNQTGPTEGFACIVENEGAKDNVYNINGTTFNATLSEAALNTEGSSATQQMIDLRGSGSTVYITGNTTYTANTDDKERVGLVSNKGALETNTITLDETANTALAAQIADLVAEGVTDTENSGVYTLGYVAAIYYYYIDSNNNKGGGYYDFYAPFEGPDPVLMDGEFVELRTNVKLTKDVTYLTECSFGDPIYKGGTFTLTFGEYNIDLNGFKFPIPAGVTVKTDKQTDIFSAAEGYKIVETAVEGGYTYAAIDASVAKIGDVKYATLEEAFAAAQDGDEVTLLANCAGNGIKVAQGKFANGLTVDFGGFTYTMDGEMVGSTGTETQAFQLLKDNTITFKNGTITSTKAKILVQNYSNLTLEGMTLTLKNADYTSAYTLSNNNGEVVINNTTINANPAGGFAFDVCRYSSYPSVSVTVKGDSEINGDVEISASKGQAKDGLSLNLNGGTMSGNIVVDATAATIIETTPEKAVVTKADAFDKAAPAGYKWESNGEGISTLVEDIIVLTDGIEYTNAANIVNAKVAYKRNFTDRTNKFQAWFVPFDYTITGTDVQKFDFYEINKVEFADENKTKMQIRLKPAMAVGGVMYANKPYLFMPKSDVGEYSFKAENVTLTNADADGNAVDTYEVDENTNVSFYGVYTSAHSDGTSYIYYMGKSGNVGYSKKTTLTAGSFRWIFKITDDAGNSPSFVYSFGVAEDNNDDDVTAVSSAAVEAEGEVVGYYTLNGQKVSEPTKGVYVVKYANGTSKKVVF